MSRVTILIPPHRKTRIEALPHPHPCIECASCIVLPRLQRNHEYQCTKFGVDCYAARTVTGQCGLFGKEWTQKK